MDKQKDAPISPPRLATARQSLASIFRAMGEMFTPPVPGWRFQGDQGPEDAVTRGLEGYFNNVWGYLGKAANDYGQDATASAAR